MACLREIEDINQKIKTSRKNTITAFHKLLFEEEGDRNNRKRIREFGGFDFSKDDRKYIQKVEYIKQNINQAGLTSICILLNLQYDRDNLIDYILCNLQKNELLKHKDDEEESDEEESDEDEGDEEDKDKNADDYKSVSSLYNPKSNQEVNVQPRFALNFRDVEDSMNYFDGSGSIAVEKWIHSFEESASLMYWDDFQRLIFAKKCMKGLAKMFIMSEDIRSWAQLKQALLSEFKSITNSAQIHKLLCERKMKKGESIREYFYKMKEIAARGNVEPNALIGYVIDGVNDLHANKVMLYGARNLEEFKEKMHNYEKFVSKKPSSNEHKTLNKEKIDVTPRKECRSNSRCFNGESSGHISGNGANKK